MKIDGSNATTGYLIMGNQQIKQLGTPLSNENGAAVNVEFFNREVTEANTRL